MFELDKVNSVANHFLAELRDRSIQLDALRFRKNLERIGEVLAYEISKTLEFKSAGVDTSLGTKATALMKTYPVLVTVLRAGLPFHQGFLNFFDKSDSAFIGAFRSSEDVDGSFAIVSEYIASPSIEGRDVIIIDPMLATGKSAVVAAEQILRFGTPHSLHFAAIISTNIGIEYIQKCNPNGKIWVGSIDERLDSRSYIVPGLGDAGDLAYGQKL